jgi:hypothetical protein
MNRPTAVALTGCLIVLVAYIVVTSASLLRELNSTSTSFAAPAGAVAAAPVQAAGPATSDNKAEIREAQVRSRRHKFKAVSHHLRPRIKQEPVTLFL